MSAQEEERERDSEVLSDLPEVASQQLTELELKCPPTGPGASYTAPTISILWPLQHQS